MFKSKQLSVRPLEVTAKVRIEDIPAVSQDHLLLYFENEGVDVEEVMLNEEEQSADITFKTHTGSAVTLIALVYDSMVNTWIFTLKYTYHIFIE